MAIMMSPCQHVSRFPLLVIVLLESGTQDSGSLGVSGLDASSGIALTNLKV